MYILDGKNDVFKRFGEQIDKTLYLTTPNKSWKSAHTATEPREPQITQNVFQRSKKLISFYDLGGEPPVMQFILVAGALCSPRSSSCSVLERCRSVAWPLRQQLQRPGALQERSEHPTPGGGSTSTGPTGVDKHWAPSLPPLPREDVDKQFAATRRLVCRHCLLTPRPP